ncbi:MAG: 5-formyltetrahydrofolate cyclo-ligase [Sphingomicrobium sp.]
MLRKAAMDARKAFVRSLDDMQRTRLEQDLAERLTSLCANASVVAGYAPMGSEISPMRAIEEARAVGAIVAFPAFSDPSKPFRFLAGDPSSAGLFGMSQPRPDAPAVEPDLVLVPLVAIDRKGARLGRGKGHYDRVLRPLRKSGARLIGVGWAVQRIDDLIPSDDWDVPLDAFVTPAGIEIF